MGRLLCVAVAGVLLCAACGEEPSPFADEAGSTTVSVLGPGTALAWGLVVPEGAELLGRVFPAPSGSSWQALMTVEGDGTASFDDLLRQAAAVGFEAEPTDRPTCSVAEEPVPPMVCSASLRRGRETVYASGEVGACGPQGASHLWLLAQGPVEPPPGRPRTTMDEPAPTTAPLPTAATSSTSTTSTTAVTTISTAVTTISTTTAPPPSGLVTTVMPRPLPGPGDQLNPRLDGDIAPVRLEAGSRLVGPPMVSCEFDGLHQSVVVLDRPTDQVVDSYARQWMANTRSTPSHVSSAEVDGVHVTKMNVDVAGGDAWYLTVAEQDGRPTHGLIATYTDP